MEFPDACQGIIVRFRRARQDPNRGHWGITSPAKRSRQLLLYHRHGHRPLAGVPYVRASNSSVDFVQIEACIKPPAPKYDLVASKKHDGNVYILNVQNAGSPIMPTGHVDVVEVVPAGLIITGDSGTPWQCPGVVFPVIGPDAFTCSYQIPAGGIPTGPLPPLMLKSEGKSECPNCMKAKLYLKSVSDGVKPVAEGDMKNNASCTM